MADVEVARLIAKLEADVRDFDRDLKRAEGRIDKFDKKTKQADRSAGALGVGLKKMAGIAAAAFSVQQIGRFAADTVRAASDVEESINAVNVTFGESSDAVLKLSDDAAQAVGLSKSQFNGLAVSVSAFATNIANSLGTDVAGVVDDLTTRMADFASVMNVDVQEAATLFRSGLAGETEPLRRFGIDLSAAAVNARALEMGLAGSKAELSEQDKVLARYNLLMEQTNKTAGDFANTSDSLANQQRTFNAALEDTKAAIGEQMLPVLADLLGSLEDLLPVLEKVGKFFARAFQGLAIVTAGNNAERLAIQTGQAADSAAILGGRIIQLADDYRFLDERTDDAGRSVGGFADELTAFISEAETTDDALRQVRDGLGFLQDEYGLTEAEAAAVAQVIEQELNKSIQEQHESAVGAGESVHELAFQTKQLGEETEPTAEQIKAMGKALEFEADRADRAREAIRKHQRALRGVHDPLFRAIDLSNDLLEAEEDLAQAIEDHGAASEEALDATRRMAEANQGLIQTMIDLEKDGVDPTSEAVRGMFANMGVPQATIDAIFAQFDALKAHIEGLNPLLTVDMFIPPIPPSIGGSGKSRAGQVTIGGFQHGGPIGANQPAIVGEAGPELFIPQTAGNIIPNGAMGPSVHIEQTFERVEGDNIEEDISLGLLLSGINEFAETS